MRTIQRQIVGAFMLSSDDKIALGRAREGGAYAGKLMIPGGGIEGEESVYEATRREMLEEVGVDIEGQKLLELGEVGGGSTEKTLKTGETVNVEMTFNDCVVRFGSPAADITLTPDDDFAEADWYDLETVLAEDDLAPMTRKTIQRITDGEFNI